MTPAERQALSRSLFKATTHPYRDAEPTFVYVPPGTVKQTNRGLCACGAPELAPMHEPVVAGA